MGCTLTLAGPGAAFQVARPVRITGRFYCVLDGRVVVGTEEYQRLALGWQVGDEESSTLVAGPAGCSLLTLDFPYPPSRVQRGLDPGMSGIPNAS
jgi:hypothetical protein